MYVPAFQAAPHHYQQQQANKPRPLQVAVAMQPQVVRVGGSPTSPASPTSPTFAPVTIVRQVPAASTGAMAAASSSPQTARAHPSSPPPFGHAATQIQAHSQSRPLRAACAPAVVKVAAAAPGGELLPSPVRIQRVLPEATPCSAGLLRVPPLPLAAGSSSPQQQQHQASTAAAGVISQPLTGAQSLPARATVGAEAFPVTFYRCHEEEVQSGPNLLDLPFELLQDIADWLPDFAARGRLRNLCRFALPLRWRRWAPHIVDEELSDFNLLDEGVRAICAGLSSTRNGGLKELRLGKNSITDEGAGALAALLASGNTKLRRLSLRENVISDTGAGILAEALAVNSTLEEVDIWGNDIGEDALLSLAARAKCEVFLELPPLKSATTQPSMTIDPKTRAILFDWIAQVQASIASAMETASDPQEMLLRTFSHVDAYLSRRPVRRSELQLVGLACTLAASRLESKRDDSPQGEELAAWLAFTTDGACTTDEIRATAAEVQTLLGSSLYRPTVYTFLRRFLRQTGWTSASFSLANYLAEIAALDASFLEFKPQAVAAAAAILSRQYIAQGVDVHSLPGWKGRLVRCSGVDLYQELAPCAAAMSRLHAKQPKATSMFINKKYEWERLHSVAKVKALPPCDASYFVNYMIAEVA